MFLQNSEMCVPELSKFMVAEFRNLHLQITTEQQNSETCDHRNLKFVLTTEVWILNVASLALSGIGNPLISFGSVDDFSMNSASPLQTFARGSSKGAN